MDDFLEQVAGRKHSGLYTVLYYLMWLLIIIFGFQALLYFSGVMGVDEEGNFQFGWINLIIAVVFGGLTFLLWRRKDYCRVEFDYTFTNGTFDISEVLNNKRRRYLCQVEMKDVVHAGPVQSPVFQKMLKESGVKKLNWFLNRDAHLYFFYFVKKNVKHLAIVELTDEMIETMRSKSTYIQRGVWSDEHGNTSYNFAPAKTKLPE